MNYENILLYGVPGSGKTTIAKKLQEVLGWDCLELDKIRIEAQIGKDEKYDPFLFDYTTSAWEKFGELNAINAIKGLLAIRDTIQPYVVDEISTNSKSFIAEAAFLDPTATKKFGQTILITCPDKEQHYNQFFVHRDRSPKTDLQFEASRYIEEYLFQEAKKLNVQIIENNGNLEEVVNMISK